MTDMRNVNNWHWVNKDCRSWAKTYLTQQLVGTSASNKNAKVYITSLAECIGDVDLNQRKGKLLAIYDVALKMSWQGELNNGTKVFGQITVPEVAYDTEVDDYVFNIIVNSSNDKEDQVKKLIRNDLTPLLREKFKNFTPDLIQNYSSDLYADSPNVTPSLVQRTKTAAPKVTLPPVEKNKNATKVVQTTVVDHSYDFKQIYAGDVYEALLNADRASIWTGGKARVGKKIGSEFSFFDGNVHGKLLQTVPNKTIVQTWKLQSWPKDHFSTATVKLIDREDGVTVNVNQIGVPVGQEEIIKRNWIGYYWNAIKDNHHQFQHFSVNNNNESRILLDFVNPRHLWILFILVIITLFLTAYAVAPSLKF